VTFEKAQIGEKRRTRAAVSDREVEPVGAERTGEPIDAETNDFQGLHGGVSVNANFKLAIFVSLSWREKPLSFP